MSFAQDSAYRAQEAEETFFDDGREIALLHFIYGHAHVQSFRNNPARVLTAIDEYGREQKYLMNVGQHKGDIVRGVIAQECPKVMVELGGYIGYSTILFGDAVRKARPGARLYSIERNPEFAAVMMALVDLAGLRDTVRVVVGDGASCLWRLHDEGSFVGENGQTEGIALLFLDHYKPAYTTDLKLCEQLGLVVPGTVLVADNMIKPGNPTYLAYVRSSAGEKRKQLTIQMGDGGRATAENDSMDPTYVAMYRNRVSQAEDDRGSGIEVRGNPNLVYDSRMVDSFEPTGVKDGMEISRCIRQEIV